MDTKSFHLEGQPAPEGILTGVGSEGEFHEIIQSASEALLAGGAQSREIYFKQQCASETYKSMKPYIAGKTKSDAMNTFANSLSL